MSSDLVLRPATLPDSGPGTSALAELSCGVVTAATAADVFELPADCSAALVAFSARALEHPDALDDIARWSYPARQGQDEALLAWARIVRPSDGRIRLTSDERVAIYTGWHGGDMSAPALRDLLFALADRTVFLDVQFGDSPSVLASLLADHPQVVGLSAECVVDAPEDPYDALSSLEHLQWLSASCWQIDGSRKRCDCLHTASTLRRLGTLQELRGLGLDFARADDLEALDSLVKLRRLWVPLEKESGDWRPQLPELRALGVTPFGWTQPWRMPDLSGCPQLESLAVDWQRNADAIVDEAASLPRLREMHIGGMGVAWLSAASIDRLATFVRLRRLILAEPSRLEVPNGLLRRLETLTALESLSTAVLGATSDDVDWLAERLPSTSLNLPIYTQLGGYLYRNDFEYQRLKSWAVAGADNIAWIDR